MNDATYRWLLAKREANDRDRRAIAFADEAMRLLRETGGDAINADGDIIQPDSDYHARRGLAYQEPKRDTRLGRMGARDRTIASPVLKVTYADGTTEVRSHADFQRNPAPKRVRDAQTSESQRVGGSQADYD